MFDRLFRKSVAKRTFTFAGQKDSFTPKQLAYWSVKWAVDSTTDSIKKMSEIPENASYETLQHRVAAAPMSAHYHLISYMVSSCYVYSAAILKVPKNVLDEMFIGYDDGISRLNIKDAIISPYNAQAMLNMIRCYAQEIYAELKAPPLDPTFLRLDAGSSASMVFKSIARAYDPEGTLDIQLFDEIFMQNIIACHGILFINLLGNDL